MSDPVPYTVSYDFSDFQSNAPSTPLPAPQVDNELANIATAIVDLVESVKDVRRSDGALKNESVTYDSLSPALQLTFDPTNGEAVADAIAEAEANAAATEADRIAAAASAATAAAEAAAAAASASSVNLSLYFPKAGNLAGVGNADTARSNINAASRDGSDMTGRLAPTAIGTAVTNWNTVVSSGWYAGSLAVNQPSHGGVNDWLVQAIAHTALWVTQIAYPFTNATSGRTSDVTPYRRHGYDTGAGIAWTPWEGASPVPVGTTIMVNGAVAPAGFLKENGALLSRASFPALWIYANASGNLVSEATWSAGFFGAFSTGDLSTTFRIPDARGEFIRSWDDGRGADSGRVIGAWQADSLKDHTHTYQYYGTNVRNDGTSALTVQSALTTGTTSSPSTGAAAETRPRNIAKLACIKY
jgi:microcystin-dependent protein